MTPEEARTRKKVLDEMGENAQAEFERNLVEIEKVRDELQRDCPHENVDEKRPASPYRHRFPPVCADCGVILETADGEVDRG